MPEVEESLFSCHTSSCQIRLNSQNTSNEPDKNWSFLCAYHVVTYFTVIPDLILLLVGQENQRVFAPPLLSAYWVACMGPAPADPNRTGDLRPIQSRRRQCSDMWRS